MDSATSCRMTVVVMISFSEFQLDLFFGFSDCLNLTTLGLGELAVGSHQCHSFLHGGKVMILQSHNHLA